MHLGIQTRYDLEANKSVALAEDLLREKDRPRCDVWWNNEVIQTIRLSRLGMLEPYASPSGQGYPEGSRPTDRTWQGFAARARIIIVHTPSIPEADRPKSLLELANAKWKGKAAMSKPLFGTGATQAVCLFEVMGDEAARRFYQGVLANGVQILPGNKQVAEEVAAGRAAWGVTDTDDALEELHSGKPVAVIFPDREANAIYPRMGTLYLPNTIALVKNAPHPEAAKKLIDQLLAPATEAELARAGGYQIPLHPEAIGDLPTEIVPPSKGRPMRVDFDKAADRWETVQAFLRETFAR